MRTIYTARVGWNHPTGLLTVEMQFESQKAREWFVHSEALDHPDFQLLSTGATTLTEDTDLAATVTDHFHHLVDTVTEEADQRAGEG